MWEEFIFDVCMRFIDNRGSKVAKDFNPLQHSGTLEAYSTRAEELKAPSLVRNPIMPESLFGGLKPAIQSFDLCDGIYSPGHKCSHSLTALGNGVNITKYDCCSEHHPLVDALQLFDESPKRNSHVMSDEWFGEGQVELPATSAVVSSDGGFSIPRCAAEEVFPPLDYYPQLTT